MLLPTAGDMTACVSDWEDIIRVTGLLLSELCFDVMNDGRVTADVSNGLNQDWFCVKMFCQVP